MLAALRRANLVQKKEALEIMKTGRAASRSFLFFGADRGAVVDVAVLVGTSSHPLNNMLLSNESKHNYHLHLLVPSGMLGPNPNRGIFT